ncbi:NAD(+)/NADH kinase [Allofrancisella guangzhouensis]|uniref:NAD kinase n=1 Tax=Allofrancisella guangzhouensis TaxID=594679 RepID=A0A0A8E506_9GAMM|nr:NAD(+)/NADH kinase [Allofrancisella guangzhouensis]AJC48667.1 inorganic polyphosphate kinase [Allofrancisella guangzhouensis]MBK2027488.1 NAD(+)/NADH kinase [Allofrancisella guangzhouensis]MBK2044498.1 NAD(+)/NADH kinase [Allofrancisella guangzhouensis]MBK2045409.1 NAD(+)/NADH kinase [Allofrancisella guangzhouensis]
MSFVYKKIAIIGKHYKKEVGETIQNLCFQLRGLGLDVIVELESSYNLALKDIQLMKLKDIALNCDVAIIIGGDGNFLQISRVLALYSNIPVIGVNKGKLGFLTTITSDSKGLQGDLIGILKGKSTLSKMAMLKCKVDNVESPLEASIALNEIAITASRGRMFGLKVFIDGRYAFDQRGDGLIVATPTGSTAHAMSAGGPILNPNQNSMVLVPVCSHSLNSRPLVISDDSIIDIYITDYNDPEPVLSIDGRHDIILKSEQRVTIRKANKKVSVLHTENYNYYDTLREKLGWGKVLF